VTLPFVNLNSRLVDAQGRVLDPWSSFFQQFTQAPTAALNILLNGSPFSYTAKEQGLITIEGAGLTDVKLIRGSINIDLLTTRAIPVKIKDTIIISYSSLPILTFLPDY
jgi:hypothetical protein